MPRSAVRIRGREGPQPFEGRIEITPPRQRIERVVEPLEFGPFRRRQHAGGAEPLVRGLRAIVDAVRARAVARLRHELLHGLKKIEGPPHHVVNALELSTGRPGAPSPPRSRSTGGCSSARVACWSRNRCTAAYSRKLARVTGPSPRELVTVTSEARPLLR